MKNYLIYRTDKIGDFLISCILIKNIKSNDKNSYITIVCSEKNYDYIKSFNYIDEIIIFNKNIFKYIFNIFRLRKKKYDFSIVHDEKNRSLLINKFIRKDKSIIIKSKLTDTKFSIIKKIISILNFNISPDDLNILKHRNVSYKKISHDYLVIHYDEKWSNLTYINKYKNIEPTEKEFNFFLNKLIKKKNTKIVITTGLNTPIFLKNYMEFNKNLDIKLIENQTFLELEKIISNSKLLISCHGAISHVAAAKNIKQIDIIEVNKVNPYSNWTAHFRNYNYVYRNQSKFLLDEILALA